MARRRRTQDRFGKQARQDGYPARSVYKLQEIDRRTQVLKKGLRVLDLGAFPGSWTMFAAKRVGPKGRVLGFDLTPFEGVLPPHAEIRQGDAFAISLEELGEDPFDLVMSDMAPATTGQKSLDQYRSYELVMRALAIAEEVLVPGGAFIAKIFQGGEFPDAKKAVKAAFDEVRVIKPEAVRAESYEVFLVGRGFKGRSTTDD
ncbi:MAG: RlmE family RNA methyltransferase [Deltaproteobacteria bacterium]|nr:MAG: RlmE family RNA methyltransferase [Deltaproteobacteria bacterium]